jgi:hypothetical protein
LQNFAAVSRIPQKILQKNEPKFVEKRGVMGLKTGSSNGSDTGTREELSESKIVKLRR